MDRAALCHVLMFSVCAECLIPPNTDATQQRRIDDHFPKRIDQSHVERREAAYAADVNPKIETVASRRLDQGAQRRSVDCSIDQLDELLVFEAVHNAEKPILRSGCCE